MRTIGPSRRRNRERMRALGDRLVILRGRRSQVDIAIAAGAAVGEELSEDWLKRLEGGTRVNMAPWELRALAEALVPATVGIHRPARVDELLYELKVLAGWVPPRESS